ncbi:MAG: hypothetical protein NTV79_11500 [Candidatus Aureabacteria bacterium]|nr:hypothetical protein [Candidatus Auribacterota bacterium]
MNGICKPISAAILLALPLSLLSCSSSGGGGGSTTWDLEGDWEMTVTVTRDPCAVEENSIGPVRVTQNGTSLTIIDQEGVAWRGSIDGDHLSGTTENRIRETDCVQKIDLEAVIWTDESITGSADIWWTGSECGDLSSCTVAVTFELAR